MNRKNQKTAQAGIETFKAGKKWKLAVTRIFKTSLLFLVCLSGSAMGRVVDEATVKETDTGFEMLVTFFTPMRFISLAPQGQSTFFKIQLSPENIGDPDDVDGLEDRTVLSWNKAVWTPLKEIIYDGSLGEYPQLTLRFSDRVKIKARSSADLRSMIITIAAETLKPIAKFDKKSTSDLLSVLETDDDKLISLLEQARQTMLENDYSRAVQIFTKIRDNSKGDIRRRAQEMIGVARESNGQLAHAKREYEVFIEDYPEGPDTDRVRQRLAAIITSARSSQSARSAQTRQEGKWETEFYGSFSQRYYRDETTPEDDEAILLRDQLVTSLDFVGKARKQDLEIKSQFIGSYRADFEDSNEDEFLPNIASLEVANRTKGLYGRLGRQSRSSGGVLGRFDGFHGAYDITDNITLNAVFGYPVEIDDKSAINTDQEFYGTSVDVRDILGGWDVTGFYITQDNAGAKDREALGAEVRYFDSKKSYFSLVDYDVYFSELNTFLFLGNWNYSDTTRYSLNLDYRNSPILTKTNAIQGQNVYELEELFDIFSDSELKQLAKDRTAINKTVTGTITQKLNEKWQVIGELTATKFDDTPASGGVEAIPGTDVEYYLAGQLIANQFLYDDDIIILGFRYGDTTNADSYTITSNWRVNVNRKFRINPRFRLDYRDNKNDSGNRWIIRPFIRLDYNLKKWVKFEMDLGYEWYDETFDTGDFKNTSWYLSLGYRVQF